jgi:hypothetical protein
MGAELDHFEKSAHALFATGMNSLAAELSQITKVLTAAAVPFELVGGMAVNAHILAEHSSRAFVTRDIDLLVRRSDLPAIVEAAVAAGYEDRKIMGGFMLRLPGQEPGEAVHLLFAGEKSKSTQPLPHPDVRPESITLLGLSVPVAPLADLVRMKLTSFRPKDLVHLQILDETGLLSPAIERSLPAELTSRLVQARIQFAADEPDVE